MLELFLTTQGYLQVESSQLGEHGDSLRHPGSGLEWEEEAITRWLVQ